MDELKRKHSSSSSMTSDSSPSRTQVEKKQRNFSDDGDEVSEALDLAASIGGKMNTVLAKLEKLDKLDSIESKLLLLQDKIDSVEDSVKAVETKLESLEVKQTTQQKEFKELEVAVNFINTSMDTRSAECKEENNSMKKYIQDVEQKFSYLEAYNRRENLKFYGINEELVEGKENTREIWNNFLQTQMEVENPQLLEIQRIHRINYSKPVNKPRPIIVRFLRYSDREDIWRRGRKLKGTNVMMFEDFPRNILNARREQLPLLIEARKNNKKANFSSTYPDKLYIDGKCVTK